MGVEKTPKNSVSSRSPVQVKSGLEELRGKAREQPLNWVDDERDSPRSTLGREWVGGV